MVLTFHPQYPCRNGTLSLRLGHICELAAPKGCFKGDENMKIWSASRELSLVVLSIGLLAVISCAENSQPDRNSVDQALRAQSSSSGNGESYTGSYDNKDPEIKDLFKVFSNQPTPGTYQRYSKTSGCSGAPHASPQDFTVLATLVVPERSKTALYTDECTGVTIQIVLTEVLFATVSKTYAIYNGAIYSPVANSDKPAQLLSRPTVACSGRDQDGLGVLGIVFRDYTRNGAEYTEARGEMLKAAGIQTGESDLEYSLFQTNIGAFSRSVVRVDFAENVGSGEIVSYESNLPNPGVYNGTLNLFPPAGGVSRVASILCTFDPD